MERRIRSKSIGPEDYIYLYLLVAPLEILVPLLHLCGGVLQPPLVKAALRDTHASGACPSAVLGSSLARSHVHGGRAVAGRDVVSPAVALLVSYKVVAVLHFGVLLPICVMVHHHAIMETWRVPDVWAYLQHVHIND